MKEFNEIDDSTPEGKLLIVAIGLIGTREPYTRKTPDEILAKLEYFASLAYSEKPEGADSNERNTAENC
ncbi:hypothetical protein [Paenibacillus sp. FSL R5-0908]|uniref:hypothetical protein n=1 Tax=Paenibacillus sp. FSL R5-0908 TaxID=2921664 RepID=UPI0030FA2CB3